MIILPDRSRLGWPVVRRLQRRHDDRERDSRVEVNK